jgi:amidase
MNGVVGLKPTVGLVSRDGIVPISVSQDTAGPMTRTALDAALVLDAIAGADPRDPATGAAAGRVPSAFATASARSDLRGVRLGVPSGWVGHHEAADAVAAQAFAHLRALGAEIVEDVDLGPVEPLVEAERIVLLVEFKAGLDAYLLDHPTAPVRSLDDVIAFNARHAERVMPYFRQELLELALGQPGLDDAAYLDARATCLRLAGTEGIDRALGEHALDALVAPTRVPAWTIDLIDGDRRIPGCSTHAAVAGYPHVSVPAGFIHGLPVGLSFVGSAYAPTPDERAPPDPGGARSRRAITRRRSPAAAAGHQRHAAPPATQRGAGRPRAPVATHARRPAHEAASLLTQPSAISVSSRSAPRSSESVSSSSMAARSLRTRFASALSVPYPAIS